MFEFLEQHGEVPLPPYIDREAADQDQQRYQTVFSKIPGAVAAPTAGLHFDHTLLGKLKANGVEIAEVTLHVGSGTFSPVRGNLEDHKMHFEWFNLPADTATKVNQAKVNGGRVVAVGTTVVRTLESAYKHAINEQLVACQEETNLFIKPGFKFEVVDALVTNFHLPKSTLLMLVSAFAGYHTIMNAYNEAVSREYRFFSYGDAMWLTRTKQPTYSTDTRSAK